MNYYYRSFHTYHKTYFFHNIPYIVSLRLCCSNMDFKNLNMRPGQYLRMKFKA